MYEERRESFSIRDLLLQVLFIVLFVFILIWLFPTKSYVKKYVDENKVETNVESGYDLDKLAVLYNQIFANNVAAMKDAAIGYYTNERLPEKVGDKEKMTLQQMYDKHLVLTLYDKDGNACDATKSYVEITKYEDEFQMKVNLSCGDEEDYIIVYLGCYDYCEASGVCEKKTTTTTPSKKPTEPDTGKDDEEDPEPSAKLCEYKKVTDGKWGEYGNWSEWSTEKVTETSARDVQTKVERVVVDYKTEKKKVGTMIETYIAKYDTERYIKEYKTEKYQSGTTVEKYISGYTTEKVAVGTKKVQVGTTTKEVTKKVADGTTTVYQSSGSGTTIPSSTSEYVYVKTGSTTSQSCSSCATVTIYTWDVFKVVTVYKTVTVTEEVPIYSVETVYETKEVPVYSTREVPVYSTRKVPVYATKKVPVYATREVDEYDYVKVAVYDDVKYYRYRTRKYIGGTTDTKWSTCDPVDTSLTKKGYYLTGNVK